MQVFRVKHNFNAKLGSEREDDKVCLKFLFCLSHFAVVRAGVFAFLSFLFLKDQLPMLVFVAKLLQPDNVACRSRADFC